MGFIKDKTLNFFVKTNGIVSRYIYGGIGLAFMLHRVLPPEQRNKYTINRGLAITPDHLESLIIYLLKQGCHFISLDELYQMLTEGKKPDRKVICLTLDDGYRDNLEYGLPVFQKHNIPVTIYVTNCFPNQTAIFWWYMLEQKIYQSNRLTIDTGKSKKEYNWKNIQQGIDLFPEMRAQIKCLPKKDFSDTVKRSFGIDDAMIQDQCKSMALTWDEVVQLSREKNITIGAHTMNHLSLKTLTDQELTYELSVSKLELEEKTGKQVNHFAYPYGGSEDAYSREYRAAKEQGFKTSTLNHRGNITMGQKNYLECIPRMPMSENTTVEKLNFMLNGIDHFSYNGFVKTIKY